jgi:hypothetical protein
VNQAATQFFVYQSVHLPISKFTHTYLRYFPTYLNIPIPKFWMQVWKLRLGYRTMGPACAIRTLLQEHGYGWDLCRHHGTPASDPVTLALKYRT